MELEKLIRKYLSEERMMQLATVSDNQPWCCTFYYASDDKMNLYWVSRPETRHSRELSANKKVSAAIAVNYFPNNPPVGMSIEGEAVEVSDKEEVEHALDVYDKCFQTGEEWKKGIVEGTDEHRVYKLVPKLIVLFDQINFSDEPRQELVLN